MKSIKTELMQSLPIVVNKIFERSKRKISDDEQIDVMQQALRQTLDQMVMARTKPYIITYLLMFLSSHFNKIYDLDSKYNSVC